jgi:hypothetical protein
MPLALAVARAGCLVAGCCRGPHGEPTPLIEIAAWLALHLWLAGAPRAWVLPIFFGSFGAVRIALAPWRADPPLGEPWPDPRWIAALQVAFAVGLAARAVGRARRDSAAVT